MNRRHAPNRCDPRAIRIAQVKFVALPTDCAVEPAAKAVAPVTTGAQSFFTFLRTHIIRVIGRLEAARP